METTILNSKGKIENGTTNTEKTTAPKKIENASISNQANSVKDAKPETKIAEQKRVDGKLTAEQPKQEVQQKPALNLESVLKLVEELHRRKTQRDRLMDTIDTLEAFEVELKDDAEETDSNYYQGCKLSIIDDNRNEFSTKNPFIIQAVAHFVKSMCTDRLSEIEAEITLPQ